MLPEPGDRMKVLKPGKYSLGTMLEYDEEKFLAKVRLRHEAKDELWLEYDEMRRLRV